MVENAIQDTTFYINKEKGRKKQKEKKMNVFFSVVLFFFLFLFFGLFFKNKEKGIKKKIVTQPSFDVLEEQQFE